MCFDLNSHADDASIIKLERAHMTGVSGNLAEKYFFRGKLMIYNFYMATTFLAPCWP